MLSITMFKVTHPLCSRQTAELIYMCSQKKAYITHPPQCTNFGMEKEYLKSAQKPITIDEIKKLTPLYLKDGYFNLERKKEN